MNKTCADCIHYDVCQYHITEETDMTVNECSHEFKDKSRFIELPCAMGDTVWIISHGYMYAKPEIESRKILSIQIYKTGDIQYHYKDGCFWQGHFGKTVFLAKEDAEKTLKESEGK